MRTEPDDSVKQGRDRCLFQVNLFSQFPLRFLPSVVPEEHLWGISGTRFLQTGCSYCHSAAVTEQLADTPTRGLPTRGLVKSRTGQVADWTTRGYQLCGHTESLA